MGSRSPAGITDTELDVLKALWSEGSSTIRELTNLIYPEGGTAHYATVQKLLDRLESKAFVKRGQRGRLNEYSAAIGREAMISRGLQETAERLCEGSLSPLLTQLIGSGRLTTEELSSLRELVDRLERETKGDSE